MTTTPAQAQTDIDDIQVYDGTGAPASPFDGQLVTIQGVITTFRGTFNSGTHYVQDATGGMQIFDPGSPGTLAVGDEVSVTGTVGSFGGEVQLGSSTWTFIGSPGQPAAVVSDVPGVLDNDGSGTQTAADYEVVGTLTSVTGTIVFLPGVEAPPFPGNTGQGSFGLTDVSGDTLQVFIDRTTGIDTAGVAEGETYQITSPVTSFNGLLQLKPRFQADLIENPGDPFPQVSNVTPNPWTPETSQSVTVSATMTDAGGILSATLFYKDASSGSFSSVAMSNVGGDTYEGTIPGSTDTGLDYYVVAEDTSNQVTSVPGDAPASFLSIAVGTTSIVDIQSTLQAGSDASAFGGQLVNVEAIITVAPGELQTSGTSNYAAGEAQGGGWTMI